MEMSQSTLVPSTTESHCGLSYPLILHSTAAMSQGHSVVRSADIPSTNYQFSRWFELDSKELSTTSTEGQLRGSVLHSPRVREGPHSVTSLYASNSIMYCKTNEDWKSFRNGLEDWEHSEMVNLSYQDLGDEYQKKNFHRCLNRLVSCKRLLLMDNSLSSLKKVTLPSCIHLNISRNQLTSFNNFPKAPNLERLLVADNNVASTATLPSLAKLCPRLKTLKLIGNPVAHTPDYRHSVFQILPRLELLDDYPPLPTDKDCLFQPSTYFSYTPTSFDKCVVC